MLRLQTLRHTVTLMALVGLAWLASIPASAQLVINEVCSKNYRVLADPYDRYPDWIELHNAGSESVQLDQFYLSDRVNNPTMWRLPQMELEAGGHVVFFSAHSASNAGHFSFGISQSGEAVSLFDLDLQLVDQLLVPYLQTDHSFGTLSNGEGQRVFAEPTPGAPNTTQGYWGYAPRPTPSIPPGPVPAGSVLYLNSPPGATLRTTLNGKDPDANSYLYVGSLGISTTMVVKAQASLPEHLPSEIMTATYFVNEPGNLPVISLSMDPDSMFHEEFGLYMPGPNADSIAPYEGANFWSNRHIPVRFEFFDEQGRQSHLQQVDLRMHGGTQARTRPQRALRLTGRSRYGNSLIQFPFFPERGAFDEYKHLVIRNSGGDYCLAHFRDGLWHQTALHAGLDIDVLGFRPIRVYINGTYWGLMNLRERLSPADVALNHGLERDSILFMDQENEPVQGDSIHFAQLNTYFIEEDLSDAQHFAYVESLFDMRSFKDYFALEIFAGNADWPANNVRCWKPSVTEGKWRYVMHDLDATMNVFGWIPMDIDMFYWVLDHREGWMHSEIFRNLLENAEFKRTFINRLADLMNTTLGEANLRNEVDLITRMTDAEAQRHYPRWSCDMGARTYHAGQIIPEFVRVRAGHVQEHVLDRFELPNTVSLTFSAFPPDGGDITLNTLEPKLPFKGIYFNGNAIDLTAHAADGFVFDHWEYAGIDGATLPDPDRTSLHAQAEFPEDGTITAHFRKEGQPILAFPVPCENELFVSVTSELEGDGELRLYDLHGRLIRATQHRFNRGVNQLFLDMSAYAPGAYLLTTQLQDRISTVRVVKATGR